MVIYISLPRWQRNMIQQCATSSSSSEHSKVVWLDKAGQPGDQRWRAGSSHSTPEYTFSCFFVFCICICICICISVQHTGQGRLIQHQNTHFHVIICFCICICICLDLFKDSIQFYDQEWKTGWSHSTSQKAFSCLPAYTCTKYKFADLVFYPGTHIFVHKVFMHSMQGSVRIRVDPWGLLIQQPDQKLPTRPIRIAPTNQKKLIPTHKMRPTRQNYPQSFRKTDPASN